MWKLVTSLSLVKNYLYITGLKQAHLAPVFRLHNIHLKFSTSPHKFKWGKNDDFVPQSIIFPLEQWKYHFFTQKVVEMPHSFPSRIFHLFVRRFSTKLRYLHEKKSNSSGNKWIFLSLEYHFFTQKVVEMPHLP